MNNPLISLAKAAANWRSRDLTPDLVWAARRALLDWFATTIPGCELPPATLLASALEDERGTGKAICYVNGLMGSARYAATLNATASHTVEFDDIFRDGGYHPGSPTISAALAIAQNRALSLEELHRAIIGGYEVGGRISLAIQPSHYRYWHTTSTVGTVGAAVAAAMLLGCDDERISHAMALASSFAGGHQQNLQGEGMAKAVHPGHAAEAGILAALAAANGVTGSVDSLSGEKGYAAATSESPGNWAYALDGLEEWTPITRMTVKNHGCCGHIFPALDGLKALQELHRIAADDISSIHVDGYDATFSMCHRPDPRSAQEARFSLQYCLAAQLTLGAVRLEAFGEENMKREDIREIMRSISVRSDPEIGSRYPHQRMARVVVYLKNGRVLNHLQEHRKGDPENPLNDAELIAKFEELVGPRLTQVSVASLKETVLFGNALPGVVAFRQDNLSSAR